MYILFKIIIIISTAITLSSNNCFAETSTLQLRVHTQKSIGNFFLELSLDQVELLAGLKIVLHYENDTAEYVKMEKTKSTASLMHVVNDKTPGRLIVVMAGAIGVSGKNIGLVNLEFRQLKPDTTVEHYGFEVTKVELMSEKLKEIKCVIAGKLLAVQ